VDSHNALAAGDNALQQDCDVICHGDGDLSGLSQLQPRFKAPADYAANILRLMAEALRRMPYEKPPYDA